MKKFICLMLIILLVPAVVSSETLSEIYTYTLSTDVYTEPNTALTILLNKLPSEDTPDWDIAVLRLEADGLQAYLDSHQPGNLSSSSALASILESMPVNIAASVSRNDCLLALPISLSLQNSILMTTNEALSHYGLNADAIPASITDLLEQACDWYASGALDNVALIQQYNSRELIVYFALQQYTIASTGQSSSLDYDPVLLQQLLDTALRLAQMMNEHKAFSSSTPLFIMTAPDTDPLSPALESTNQFRLEDAGLSGQALFIPLQVTSGLQSNCYYTGLVALVNPDSSRFASAVSLLESEAASVSSLTTKYLDISTAPSDPAVQSETLTSLSAVGTLYDLASQLAQGSITTEQCIDTLLYP